MWPNQEVFLPRQQERAPSAWCCELDRINRGSRPDPRGVQLVEAICFGNALNRSVKSPVSLGHEPAKISCAQKHGAAVGKLVVLEFLHFIVPGHARQLLDLGNAIDADEFGDDEFTYGGFLFLEGRMAWDVCYALREKERGALLPMSEASACADPCSAPTHMMKTAMVAAGEVCSKWNYGGWSALVCPRWPPPQSSRVHFDYVNWPLWLVACI
ncbi:hypothetical protein NKJ74_27710 [Mesorhizobium sp. M0046]|uniref:hypothetical protein n=1 Tax=Mesorhizobium sp. M0046 TaxID=2956858 RepID=UPI0033367F38